MLALKVKEQSDGDVAGQDPLPLKLVGSLSYLIALLGFLTLCT